MEILDMLLDTIKSSLGYSADTTQKLRANFKKIQTDLTSMENHIKEMVDKVTHNL